jgi:hypothetical protein
VANTSGGASCQSSPEAIVIGCWRLVTLKVSPYAALVAISIAVRCAYRSQSMTVRSVIVSEEDRRIDAVLKARPAMVPATERDARSAR